MAPPHIKQSEDIVYTLYFLIICVRTMCIWYYTVMRRSMTGIRSEKCVVRRFRRPVNVIEHHSIVNTNTRTLSLVKIYYKQLKKLLHVSVYDHHQGVIMSLSKSLLFKLASKNTHTWDAPQAQTDPNNMICCHTTTLSIHTIVV